MGKEKELSDELQKHSDNQTKLGNTFHQVFTEVLNKCDKDSKDKASKIIEDINKLLVEENKCLTELSTIEEQSNEELFRLSAQMADRAKGAVPDFDDTSERHKSQQMNSIWSDTLQDFNIILNKQKDQMKRLDQNRQLTAYTGPQQTRPQGLNALLEKKENNVNEFLKKLEKIRKDMEQTVTQIENTDRLEREKISKTVEKSNKLEEEEKRKNWKKFLDNFKRHAKSAEEMQ